MAIWNDRIHERRIEKGITLAQVAEKLGVTEATAQRYECGNIKNIPYEYMCAYGEILHCSPAYLMGWNEEDSTIQKRYTDLEAIEKILSSDGYTLCCENYDDDYFYIKASTGKTIAGLYDYELLPRYDYLKKKGTVTAEMLLSSSFSLYPGERDHIQKYRLLDPHGKEMVDFTLQKEWERSTVELKREPTTVPQTTVHNPNIRLINYYYRLASAGTGQIVFDTPPTKRIEIPDIPEYKKADYAIGVNGNSMEPAFHDGDMLLIEMTDDITPGEVGIFLVDNESYVKKLGDGELISLNPEYSNIPLTENSKCMGRVIDKL